MMNIRCRSFSWNALKMKIDLSAIDTEQFLVHSHMIGDQPVWLVQPTHIGVKWTQANKHFRSSVWDDEGNPVSLGFPKFVNFGENPEHFPTPDSLKNCICTEKLDGSLLIVSKWKGNYILRTRGTVDAHKFNNGYELELFRSNHPEVFSYFKDSETWDFSLLFEWLSPANRVVIRVEEPQFNLVGVVNHEDYSLWPQDFLDKLAKDFCCGRPKTYSFDSISDLLELVEKWEGKEGVVIYSNKGQTLHKVKSDWYKIRHFLKDEFSNREKVVDLFIQENCPSHSDFSKKIADITDWETVQEIQGDISKICDVWKNTQKIVSHMKVFVEPLKSLPRRDAALKIMSSYGKETNRSSFCFTLLDGKELSKDQLKKLLWQSLKE